ncbi:hypothetical protein FACS1894188_06800 [Clostridia bacterium]|nr:hypothetical protein FACS1894188_06800 [Clostridia bacterium]
MSLRAKTTGFNIFVVPVEFELDLKKAATAVGDKYIETIKSKDLEPVQNLFMSTAIKAKTTIWKEL